MDYEAAIRQLRETEIVNAAIQARHAEFLKEHEKWLEQSTFAIARHEAWFAKHELVMAEIEDKLNGLIGFVDDSAHKRKPE
jgi:hypothetical protein